MDTAKYAHIISHTHWDREWYLNSKYTNEWLVPFFDNLFEILEKEPQYKFVLDGQTSMIEDYFDQLELQGKNVDEFKNKIKKYASEERLVIGPYYLQPDWQLISEEAVVRNLLIGHRMAQEFGKVMKVGWLLDNFGQISQTPQVHKEFDMKGLFVWRGVEMDPTDINSEFSWEAPDGTKMTSVYFLSSYRNAMRLAEYSKIMNQRIKSEVEKLMPFATTPNVLLMNGYDQEMIPDDILPYIQNGRMDFGDVKVVQSTPEEYMEAVKKYNPRLKELKGALYSGRFISVFPGILSSRMYLKLQNDICQRELEKFAEPLSTILWCLGQEYKQDILTKSWKLLLKNHPHDSICGVSIDDVHTDMEKRFEESYSLSNGLANSALNILVSNINTTKCDKALSAFVVLNTLPENRSSVIAIKDDIDSKYSIQDGMGRYIPYQKDETGITKVYVKDVPALGYKTIFFVLEKQEEIIDTGIQVNIRDRLIENEFLKVQINDDGTLNIEDKITKNTYTNMGIFEDGADAGDEYNYSYPQQDTIITSKDKEARICFVETGPLRAKVRIETALEVPETLSPDRKTRSTFKRRLPIVTWVTLEVGSPVLKFKTKVKNTVKDHRLRILFPTGLCSEYSYAETQFDVTQHKIVPESYDDSNIPENVKRIIIGAREPEPITIFPQRAFVDIHDGGKGVAVLNQGLPEYEILKEKNTIALTLFRGVNWVARHDLLTRIGDAGPAICTPDAQCLRTMEFRYALYLHKGDWKEAKVPKYADYFNTEFRVVRTDQHQGVLPDEQGFMQLKDESGNLKVTAVKRAEDGSGFIIRFYNTTEQQAEAGISLALKIKNAYYVNLNEEVKEKIEAVDGNTIKVIAGPKKIISVKIEPERQYSALEAKNESVQRVDGDIDQEYDFSEYQAVEFITEEEIEKEEKRAAETESELAEKQQLLERYKDEIKELKLMDDKGLVEVQFELSKMELDVETYRRTALEARLSAVLLRKKYMETYCTHQASYEMFMAKADQQIREIGYKLNDARVSKRVYEYIVDVSKQNLKTS
ncbi:alpha-mannosidase [Petroclostridium xylanilyticum]|uniref:alpha-mannosidase n=1 Tax=Petroclostridium xylanilyticum TaxID=1792311 RepID=UPI000B997F05|nr:glycoside hydrolase family 38 C-terminal domain-containing protein [Petroclostridium xylanilyticum]